VKLGFAPSSTVLFVCAAVSLACRTEAPSTATPSPRASSSPTFSGLAIEFSKALNARRVGSAVARYAPDAVLMAPNGDILSGRTEIDHYWTALVADRFTSLTLQPFRSSVADAVAYETGTYELRLRRGGGPVVETGQFVTVYKRADDGTWRVVYDVLNNLPLGSRQSTVHGRQ
jgi:ketosteroid isomerase-like protein